MEMAMLYELEFEVVMVMLNPFEQFDENPLHLLIPIHAPYDDDELLMMMMQVLLMTWLLLIRDQLTVTS
jgi:hypothetical protein